MNNLKYTPAELNDRLCERIEAVLGALGVVYKRGGERLDIICPWSGETWSTISMRMNGFIGGWKKWNGDEAGDLYDFVAFTVGGGTRDRQAAQKWILQYLGLEDVTQKSPEEMAALSRRRAQQKIEYDKKRALQEKQWQKEISERRKRAYAIWCRASEIKEGDAVWQYLLNRGIDCRLLPYIPKSLRILPSEEHIGENGVKTTWPCMVAAMYFRDGTFAAIHRTWIDLSNKKGRFKAPVQGAKKMYPANAGSFIPLFRGQSRKPAGDMPPKSEIVMVFEGIENALSYALLNPKYRIDVAGSLSLIGTYPVPKCAIELRIGADKFDNEKAQAALTKTIFKHKQKYGIGVLVNYAPGKYKDWNDALMGELNGKK